MVVIVMIAVMMVVVIAMVMVSPVTPAATAVIHGDNTAGGGEQGEDTQ
jgi:hypothetical protein